jgi:hypothetical protein
LQDEIAGTLGSQWNKSGGCVYDFWASTENLTVCNCTHLTLFSVSQDVFVPQVNLIDASTFRDLTWENLKNHPTSLIGLSVMIGLYCVMFVVAHRRDALEAQRDLTADREVWAAAFLDSQESRSLSDWWKHYRTTLSSRHLWITFATHPAGETFTSKARLTVLTITLFLQVTAGAMFHGTDAVNDKVTIAFYSFLIAGLPSELLIYLFKYTGEMGFRDVFRWSALSCSKAHTDLARCT